MQETPAVTGSEALVRFQRCIVKSASDESITMVQYGTQPGLTGSGYLGSVVWTLDALSADNSTAKMNALVSTKADKVSNAVAENFAALDENGSLKDSGESVRDFASRDDLPDVPVQDVQMNGESILSDGVANIPLERQPTILDRVEAQVLYTALMTDTMIEGSGKT